MSSDNPIVFGVCCGISVGAVLVISHAAWEALTRGSKKHGTQR